jgi:hypothetical protein
VSDGCLQGKCGARFYTGLQTMTVVRELVTFLGIEGDERAVQKWDDVYTSLRNTALGLAGAITGAGAAVFAFANSTANAGNEVAKASVEAGLSVQKYQELRFSLQRLSRVSEGEIDRAFSTLTQTLGRARAEGGRYAESLNQLGFSNREIADGTVTSEEVIRRLSRSLKAAKTDADAAVIASDVFGERVGRRLGPAIRASNESLEELSARFRELGGGFSEEGAKAAEAFSDAMLDLKTAMNAVRVEVGTFLLPVIQEVIDDTTNWIRANRDFIKINFQGTLKSLVGGLKEFWSATRAAFGVANTFAQSLGGWANIFQALKIGAISVGLLKLGKILTVIGASVARAGGFLALFSRILTRIPKVAALVGIALVFEDIYYWVAGSNSLIGKFLGSFENFKNQAFAIGEMVRAGDFSSLEKAMSDIGSRIGDLIRLGIVKSFSFFTGSDESTMAMSILDSLKRVMGLVAEGLKASVGAIVGGSIAGGQLVASTIKSAIGLPETGILGAIRGDKRAQALAQPPSPSLMPVGSGVRSVSQQLNIKSEAILQVPAGTPEEQQRVMREQAQKIVQEQWDKEIRKAITNFPEVD